MGCRLNSEDLKHGYAVPANGKPQSANTRHFHKKTMDLSANPEGMFCLYAVWHDCASHSDISATVCQTQHSRLIGDSIP
jgi:hypothetical protein